MSLGNKMWKWICFSNLYVCTHFHNDTFEIVFHNKLFNSSWIWKTFFQQDFSYYDPTLKRPVRKASRCANKFLWFGKNMKIILIKIEKQMSKRAFNVQKNETFDGVPWNQKDIRSHRNWGYCQSSVSKFQIFFWKQNSF